MLYALLFVYMLFFSAVLIAVLYRILYKLDDLKNIKQETKTRARKHATIKTSNYNNSFNRRGYDQFKNEKTGLYEPQRPHKGIELKANKED